MTEALLLAHQPPSGDVDLIELEFRRIAEAAREAGPAMSREAVKVNIEVKNRRAFRFMASSFR